MSVFNLTAFDQHEQILFCADKRTGLKAVIAIHDTTLGPAVGGCRMWPYDSDEAALIDVLRLSRGMTYKNAMADLPMGGGKSVIIGDPQVIKKKELLHVFGKYLNSLSGRYYTAEDVGMAPQDMAVIREETPYVLGLEGKSGDPSPYTAYGVYLGIKVAVEHRLHKKSLEGVKVAVQGVGHVGYHLCQYLARDGAKLYVTDLNRIAVERAAAEFGAEVVAANDIYSLAVDVYAPCALGATLNDKTIPLLQASIVAGAANNQLAEERHGWELTRREILYAPDYVINAGGIINVSLENNYNAEVAKQKVSHIAETLASIFSIAREEGKPTFIVADEMARQKIDRQKTDQLLD